jgi:hypothetical protein
MANFNFSNTKTTTTVYFNDGEQKATFKATTDEKDGKMILVDLKDIDLGDAKQAFIDAFNSEDWADTMREALGVKGIELGMAIMNARADFLQRNGRASR